MDVYCGDCKDCSFEYYYSFPHPEKHYWKCNVLGIELNHNINGVLKNSRCPKLLEEVSHTNTR